MNKRSGIYQIVNEVNGKSYVGSSKDISNRWRGWRSSATKNDLHYRSLLHDAFCKYGIENFTFILLEECKATRETLIQREQYYIDTIKPEYNILQKAYSNLGYKFTEDQKQRHSERLKQVWENPELREKRSASTKQQWDNAESRECLIQARREASERPEVIHRRSEALKARPDHIAYITKLATKANEGLKRSDETKEKLSESHRNSAKCQAVWKNATGKMRKNNTSGHPGLSWNKSNEVWQVRFSGKQYGAFKDKEKAIARAKQVMTELGIG